MFKRTNEKYRNSGLEFLVPNLVEVKIKGGKKKTRFTELNLENKINMVKKGIKRKNKVYRYE